MLRVLTVISLILVSVAADAMEHKCSIGAQGGVCRLNGYDSAFFPYQPSWGVQFDYRIGERWTLQFDLSRTELHNDSTEVSILIFNTDANADVQWKGTRLAGVISYDLFSWEKRLNISPGLGGGLLFWKMVDADSDSLLKRPGIHNEMVDFAASEVIMTAQTTIRLVLSSRWFIKCQIRGDYLTGLGAEFAAGVRSSTDMWLAGSSLSLNYAFGRARYGWKSQKNWPSAPDKTASVTPVRVMDSDGDGVPNDTDQCLSTPRGAIVDASGCSRDSDSDGVIDGLDDCPDTDTRSGAVVDIYGCPVDTDSDGIADYLDDCPFNRIGATVDADGCPVDSDGDSIPDGLDDCPNTLYGAEVDKFGCIDLSAFSEPMVLNIDYVSGSFEIDPKTRKRLRKLATVLTFVPDMKLEINGYTDNIGTSVANRKLSLKRARRVRDYLETLGVNTDRMKTFGRGETNFLSSNQTAKGRSRNRRIQILFYR
ncbi:MAG: OmpA family protein [candidate division Zixibacteria bacterium]|nr:OmpA family protein [candidate division Zixibacteria bacterium]